MSPPATVWRAHSERKQPDRGLWHFAHTPDGRFNLVAPNATCYFANAATAALRERLGNHAHSNRVPASALSGVLVSRVSLTLDNDLADLCHEEAIEVVGMNREVHTTSDYETTRAWGTHLLAEGFGGIRYQPRHTMGPGDYSFAIFGPTGVAAVPPDECSTAEAVAAEAGLTVLPSAPNLDQARIVTPQKRKPN